MTPDHKTISLAEGLEAGRPDTLRSNGNTNKGRRMPKVIFITLDGTERAVDATLGESVMAAAVRNGVPGIVGECGGNCSCATCHVYVADEFSASVGGAGDMED